jgi:PPOX class probable F420-dependent enzyme
MAMTQAEIDNFLQEVHLARVATVRPDGRPHVVPVWYLWEEGHLFFETARKAVKANNLRTNPHIAITVDVTAGGLRLKYVILEGQAAFIEERRTVRQIAEKIYNRYVGIEGLQTPTVQEMLNADIVVVKLLPTKFATMDQLSPAPLSVV